MVLEKDIAIALISAVATLLGVAAKDAIKSWREKRLKLEQATGAASVAEVGGLSHAYELLIAAHNQMNKAVQEWTKREIELSHARYEAEERCSRLEADHKRELREARRFTEEQHEEIIKYQAVIEARDREVAWLNTRLAAAKEGIPNAD